MDGPLDADISVIEREDGMLLRFVATYKGVKSTRTLAVDDCEAATEAAAVLLLLTIDPLLAESLGMPPPASTEASELPSPKPPSQSEPTAGAPSPPPPAERSPATEPQLEASEGEALKGFLALSAVMSHGGTRELGFGPGLRAGAHVGVLEAAVAGYWLPERTDELSGVPGGTLGTSSLTGLVELHLHFEKKQFAFGPLVSFGGVRVSAQTAGVSSPDSAATQWMVFQGGAFANMQLQPEWALGLNAAAVLPLQRPTFSVDGLGLVHQPDRLGIDVFMSALWIWGSQSPRLPATE